MQNKKICKPGDVVRIVIDYEITESDGKKFNPKGRYGIVKTVHEETLPPDIIRYDYYIEIQGKPYNPYWFIDSEVEKIE